MDNITSITNCEYMEYEKDDCIQDIVYEKYQNSLKDQILAILTLIAINDYDLAIESIQCLIDNNEEIIVPGFEDYGDLSERLVDYCRGWMDNKSEALTPKAPIPSQHSKQT